MLKFTVQTITTRYRKTMPSRSTVLSRILYMAMTAIMMVSLNSCASGSGPLSGPPLDFDHNNSPLSGNYDGADAGYLITTLGRNSKGRGFTELALYIRTIDKSKKGRIWWGEGNPVVNRSPDIIDDREVSIIDVRRLPPGNYELYDFFVVLGPLHAEAPSSFSIPFTISPNHATYIGDFVAVDANGMPLFSKMEVYFVLSDKFSRDVVIARQKQPAVPSATDSSANPDQLGNPTFRSETR